MPDLSVNYHYTIGLHISKLQAYIVHPMAVAKSKAKAETFEPTGIYETLINENQTEIIIKNLHNPQRST